MSAIEEPKPQPKCSVCYNVIEGLACIQCSKIFTSVLSSLTTPSINPFSNIENLVFQGGGVKGAAYLGVLEQLESESNGILTRIKRVAGSSAGSLVSLYLALNLELEDVGKLVIDKKYTDLLDDGLALTIKDKNKTVKARLVFLTAIKYFKQLQAELLEKNNWPSTYEKIKNISKDIKGYCSSSLWFYERFFFNKVLGDRAAEAFTSVILGLLGFSNPIKKAKKKTTNHDNQEFSMEDMLVKGFLDPISNQTPDQHPSDTATIGAALDAQSNVIKESGEGFGAIFGWGAPKGPEEIEKFDLEDAKGRELLHFALAELVMRIKEFEADNIEYEYDTKKIEPTKTKEEKEAYLAQKFNIQKDDTKKEPMGVFTGVTVLEQLIRDPIKEAFGRFNQTILHDQGPTFAEMAAAQKDGQKVFKDLYVTAFNCATNRTEIFSPEHTPNVFVADAVRASMSIPGFFKPVNIRQKNGNAAEPRKIYKNEKENEDILFMDGGCLDNYPLWIFDDIKYLLPKIEAPAQNEQTRIHRFTIQNPRTLGFKLLDNKTLDRYTKPYIDSNFTQMKRTNEDSQETGNKWTFIFGSLANAKMDQEENEFIKLGNCPRTAYVDNANVSAIAFDLKELFVMDENNQFVLDANNKKIPVVDRLIQNGRDSVTEFKARYGKRFLHEGEAYPAYNY